MGLWLCLLACLLAVPGAHSSKKIRLPLAYRNTNVSRSTVHDLHHQQRGRRLESGDTLLHGSLRLGYYYANIWLGTPPQKADVILDTGSSVTAIPCTGCVDCGTHDDRPFKPQLSSTYEEVACGDPACGDLGTCHDGDRCGFSVHYSEDSSLVGHFGRDTLWFAPGVEFDAGTAFGGIAFEFGCAEKLTKMFKEQSADGIMGLSGPRTVLERLHDEGKVSAMMMSMCIAAEGGHLTLGGYEESLNTGPLFWAPMTILNNRFTVQLEELAVEGSIVGTTRDFGVGYSVVLDSGTTYTYIPTKPYRALLQAREEHCGTTCRAPDTDKPAFEHTCFTFTEKELETLDENFPTLKLSLPGGVLIVPPSQYITPSGLTTAQYCVNIYDNYNAGTVIGANLMQNFNVVYDLEGKKVGFARAACDRLVDSDGDKGGGGRGYGGGGYIQPKPTVVKVGMSKYYSGHLQEAVGTALAVAAVILVSLCVACCVRRCCCQKKEAKFERISETEDMELTTLVDEGSEELEQKLGNMLADGTEHRSFTGVSFEEKYAIGELSSGVRTNGHARGNREAIQSSSEEEVTVSDSDSSDDNNSGGAVLLTLPL